ncbi:PREDICTED: E3 ubiquitin-protein ligase At3g02290-like [Nelumbo nucifera]|uniref:RING-type E3 ubiquitin transferase n=1 Tax=Nelumbo nucifera TaxID=4432 RepID=A0A1U8BC68_NELNU|nr:PREDICTED: E3 ubiquitin-protein ligase At3g02290-like [Nelumbo nucifera]
MYRSPPRPLPYDSDPRCFCSQQDGLISRHEKGSSHLHEESEPLRRSDADTGLESPIIADKGNGSTYEKRLREYPSESSMKNPLEKLTSGIGYIYSSSEDDDVYPTCLEEYTLENPKIITNCSHHFHLGCIYEWMERSENCPHCGKRQGQTLKSWPSHSVSKTKLFLYQKILKLVNYVQVWSYIS